MPDFRFANPWMLLLLLLLPVVAVLRFRRNVRRTITFSLTEEMAPYGGNLRTACAHMLPMLRLLCLLCLIVTLARPQKGNALTKIESEGIAIEMVLDVSGSMQALDFEIDRKVVNRLETTKSVFKHFVMGKGKLKGRPNDLIGIVSFASYPVSNCPLTLDHEALLKVLDNVQIPAQNQETAIGDAIALATLRLKEQIATSKIMILLTDGENNTGKMQPEKAAEIARAMDVKIYTIGIGSQGTAPFPVDVDRYGKPIIRNIPVTFDEHTLKSIASITKGRYFHAKDTRGLQKIYQEIDAMERTKMETKRYLEYDELFIIPLMSALFVFLMESLLRFTWLKVSPAC